MPRVKRGRLVELGRQLWAVGKERLVNVRQLDGKHGYYVEWNLGIESRFGLWFMH